MNYFLRQSRLIVLFLVLLAISVHAQNIWPPGLLSFADQNISDANISPAEKEVLEELNALQEEVSRMQSSGLSTSRIMDGLIIAQEKFRQEKENTAKGKTPTFFDTRREISDIIIVTELAYDAKDEIDALKKYMQEVESEIDLAPVKEILKKALIELRNERYERAIELANEGQLKIVDLQSVDTKAKAAAEAATSNLFHFLDVNKYAILSLVVGGIVFYLVLGNRLKHYIARARIRALELERDTIKKEIQRAQTEFFVKGTLSETTYHIRINVFNRLTREIARKIAVYTEAEKKTGFFQLSNFFPRKKEEKVAEKESKHQ